MRSAGRIVAASLLVLGLASGGAAQSPLGSSPGAPAPPAPALPRGTVVIGALLPLTGPSAWIGKEMRQGMELAIAELKAAAAPGPAARSAPGTPGVPGPGPATGKGTPSDKAGTSAKEPATGRGLEGSDAGAPADTALEPAPADRRRAAAKAPARDSATAAEPSTASGKTPVPDRPGASDRAASSDRSPATGSTPSAPGTGGAPAAAPGAPPVPEPPAGPPAIVDLVVPPVTPLALETRDVATRDTRAALAGLTSLLSANVPVVVTASPTPTLAIHSEAAARDVLVIHQGPVTAQFAAPGRTIVHARPPAATRALALVAYARGRSATRLAVLAGGDEFGKAVRAAAVGRWRAWGLAVVQDESLLPGGPDVKARLRRLVRLAPDALLLGFEGADLGDVARQVREAGYPGFILALDDDPAVALAAGPGLEPAIVLAEAFVAEPETRAARFADAYQKKFAAPPSRWAAQAYETVAMIAEGLKAARAAGGQPVRGTRLREALVARRSFPALTGERVVLGEDGTIDRPLALSTATGDHLTFVRYLDPAASGAAPVKR
jgi:branched-chain amino acid transport system substrate-binding protein